VRTEESRIST